MSRIGRPINEKIQLPGRPIDYYLDFKSEELKSKWSGKKIPMQIFHDLYFDGKVEFKGEVLDVMEYRHDWASFAFTPEVSCLFSEDWNHMGEHERDCTDSFYQLFRYVFMNLIPDVILHSQSQDEEQVRDHYDRGDDFYSWFLGPRMIYTSGVISDINKMETLEELQDNKLTMVCEKLDLQKGDKMLDIGCGWGTLATFAAKNYGADVTGGQSFFSLVYNVLMRGSDSRSKPDCIRNTAFEGERYPRIPRPNSVYGLS